MSEKKSCSIYSIYRWMGVMGKYTGCFPLPGLYEKREWSKWTKAVINYVIPALNVCFLIFVFVMYCELYTFKKNKDLTDILLVIVDISGFVHYAMCVILNHSRVSRMLVSYLKLYVKVDEVLRAEKQKIKHFVSVFFVVFTVFYAVDKGLVNVGFEIKSFYKSVYENPSQMLIMATARLLVAYIIAVAVATNPHMMYIVFQHILKSAFDELLNKIETSEKLSCEKQAETMRKCSKLYGDLCKLSTQLDDMTSPLLLFIFVLHYTGEIHGITLFTCHSGDLSASRFGPIFAGSVVLLVVANFAYITKKAHNKILPAIYSTFISEDKIVKTELQNFALQSMYFNKSFSVSGFFKLDREFIIAIFQSLVSQVVVFYRICQENTYKPDYD